MSSYDKNQISIRPWTAKNGTRVYTVFTTVNQYCCHGLGDVVSENSSRIYVVLTSGTWGWTRSCPYADMHSCMYLVSTQMVPSTLYVGRVPGSELPSTCFCWWSSQRSTVSRVFQDKKRDGWWLARTDQEKTRSRRQMPQGYIELIYLELVSSVHTHEGYGGAVLHSVIRWR
jgi:hypothetical protein